MEDLQQRLADVESDHKKLADDNVALQHRLEEHQVQLEQRTQRYVENESHWHDTNAQVGEVPKSSDRTMDVAAYEERLEVHEQHLRNHADQLVESETSLADLRDQLRLAEAERDRERQEHERLLRKQLELVQASQRNFSPGAGPIHQYKDFKTV